MSNGNFTFSVPDDAHALLLSSGSVSRVSRPLSSLVEKLSADSDAVVSALAHQEDGSLPIMLDGRIWISTSSSAGDQKLVVLKSPSKLELDEWLETDQGGGVAMLTDGSGNIYAATESANQLFAGFSLTKLSDFLDQISTTAFLSAASSCISGKKGKDFSVLTKKGQSSRKSQVITLRRTGVMNHLLIVVFSSPSMAMRSVEQDASKFSKSLFSIVPVPAVLIDERSTVTAVNGMASAILKYEAGQAEVSFLDWIAKDDRERVSMLLRRRFDSSMAPGQFRTGLSVRNDPARQFEVTSMLMPDRESFMLFLVPVSESDFSDQDAVSDQLTGELIGILESFEDSEGYTRMILEFLRTGTGAKGASFVSRTRRVTVGEAVPPVMESQMKTLREPVWTEDLNGYTVTIPVKQKHAQALIRISGIPSRIAEGIPGLVIAVAPVLAAYLQSGQQLEAIVQLLNSISTFMDLVQGRERDISTILGEICSIVGADYSVVHTISSREPVLNQMVTFGTTTDPGPLRIEIPSISSWAYTHTETCYVPDTAVDQRFSSVFPSSRSEMAIPLIAGGKTMGTLTVGCTRRDAFGYPSGSFLGTLAAVLSLWLFRESRGPREEGSGNRSKDRVEVPGLEDLLLSISYRMKAPITTIRGYADILASEKSGKLNEEQKEAVRSINHALVGLTEYAEKILNFMKIELGQESLETSWTRPSDVVSSMLPLLAEKGRERGVNVTAELPSDPFSASFDRARMQQIISNLVDNGIEFNRPGGNVRIEVRMDGTGHWVLEVFNTGEGISPEDLPNVFDRFYAGGPRTGGSGLGIGLTIVRSFTQQMGGTVNVRSREGSGTWFTVRLPIS